MPYINKLLNVDGATIYPVTIPQAVIDPTTKLPAIFGRSTQPKISLTRLGCVLYGTTTAGQSIYFPSVVRNRLDASVATAETDARKKAFYSAKYWMYYSTDHEYVTDSEISGISVAYADNIAGPWKTYATSDVADSVLVDGAGGIGTFVVKFTEQLPAVSTAGKSIECETPSVWYNESEAKYYMVWHSATGVDSSPYNYAQTSHISSSTDGLTWTYVKRMLDIPMYEITGNGHNGYAQIYQHDNSYYATILLGGGNGYMTNAFSYDGIHWMVDPMQDNAVNSCFKVQGTVSPGKYVLVEFNQSALFQIEEMWYKIGGAGIPAAGTAAKSYDLYCMHVLNDKRTPAGIGSLLLSMDTTLNETKNIRNTMPFVDDDGQVYIFYTTRVATKGITRIHVAKLEVK